MSQTFGHATRAGHTSQQPFHYEFGVESGFPQPPTFDDKFEEREYLKGRLAAAFRIFGEKGFSEGVAGHITLRDPVEIHTFWVNPFGISFNLIRCSDLIRLDYNGQVLEGGKNRLINRAAVMIHAAVHKARLDVVCAAHSHTIYGKAFSTLGRPLKTLTQDACAFYNDCALYDKFEGIVLEASEGENIAKAIGDKKAVILKNHGLLTASPTVEATVFWFTALEKCCQVQLLADAAATSSEADSHMPMEAGDAEAAETYKNVGPPMAGWFSARPMFDEIAKKTNEDYLG